MVKPALTKKPNSAPPAQRARFNKPLTPHDVAVEAKLQMPNERDESVDGAATTTGDSPDPMIEQAALDIARGLQDTSKAVELNTAYKKLK